MLQRLVVRDAARILRSHGRICSRAASIGTRQWSTPLAKTIAEAIQVSFGQQYSSQADLWRRQGLFQSLHTCDNALRIPKAVIIQLNLLIKINSEQKATSSPRLKFRKSLVNCVGSGSLRNGWPKVDHKASSLSS